MLVQILKKEIPNRLNTFDKFTEGRDPYTFTAWDNDGNVVILRYWFWNKTRTKQNRKRVFINELEDLLKQALISKRITRQDSEKFCPRTSSDGPCGFAVIIRILQHLQVIDFVDGEYRIKNLETIQTFLNLY